MENRKSKALLVASRLIGLGGLLVCMLGAIIYLALHVPTADTPAAVGPFEVENLYIIAGIAAVCVIIGIVLRIMSNCAAKKTIVLPETVAEEEITIEEQPAEEALEEVADEVVESDEDEVSDQDTTVIRIKKINPETKEKVLKTLKDNATTIAAVAATVAVVTVVGKISNERKNAKRRKDLLRLFY